MLFVLIAVCIFFDFATEGIFLSTKNITNLTRQSSIVGLLAIGMVLIIVCGHIDLSVGSLVGLIGGTSAIFASWYHWNLPTVIIATLILGLLLGAMQGFMVAYLRIPAFIVTLGGLMIFRGAIKGLSRGETISVENNYQFFGSGFLSENQSWVIATITCVAIFYFLLKNHPSKIKYGLNSTPVWTTYATAIFYSAVIIIFIFIFNNNDVKFPDTADENEKSIPVPVIILVLFALVFHFVATRTTFGRRIFAIGGNPDAAYLSGINIKQNTMFVFVIMGILSAVAAIVYTARLGSATADAGRTLELDAIAACVIGGTSLMGGKGNIPAAIVGALFMTSLDNGMSIMNIENFYQDIIKGLVLVLAVYMGFS